jgi:hypothetical protein
MQDSKKFNEYYEILQDKLRNIFGLELAPYPSGEYGNMRGARNKPTHFILKSILPSNVRELVFEENNKKSEEAFGMLYFTVSLVYLSGGSIAEDLFLTLLEKANIKPDLKKYCKEYYLVKIVDKKGRDEIKISYELGPKASLFDDIKSSVIHVYGGDGERVEGELKRLEGIGLLQ